MEKPLRIKFISRRMGAARGGGETFDLEIAKRLRHLGCEVNFITARHFFGNIKHKVEGFETTYCRIPYLVDLAMAIPKGSSILMFLDNWLFESQVLRLLKRKNEYDIAQICSCPNLGYRTVRELNKPAVVRMPGPGSLKLNYKLRGCNATVASGDAFKKLREVLGKNAHYISNGIDGDLFKRVKSNNLRLTYGIKKNEKILLFVGRFVPYKNLPFLISVFRETLKEDCRIKLVLIGEGALFAKIKKLTRIYKIADRVIFTGHIQRAALAQHYSLADLFILGSSYESFPNAVLEAMACELPVVATRVGGVPIIVKHEKNGLLVKNNDVGGFKNAIFTFLNDKGLCGKMGRRNREEVLVKYDWMESARKLKEIYEALI